MTPEDANRAKKAYDLAQCIRRHGGDADTAAQLGDDGWAKAARVAFPDQPGYVPSAATRAACVAMLRQAEATADPFAGLG